MVVSSGGTTSGSVMPTVLPSGERVQPSRGLDVSRQHGVVLERPRQGVTQGPPPRPLPVECELRRETVQTLLDECRAVTEPSRPDDAREAELAFAHERFRIDHEPRLTRCP